MPAPALLSEPAMVSATGGLADISMRRPQGDGYRLSAVAADRLDRAAFHRLLAERFFLGTFRLLVNEGVAAVVVAFVISGRGFPAKIAVDALVIDVVGTRDVFRIFICGISHNFPAKSELEGRKKPPGAQMEILHGTQGGAANRQRNG